jgi:hypothetical protein
MLPRRAAAFGIAGRDYYFSAGVELLLTLIGMAVLYPAGRSS